MAREPGWWRWAAFAALLAGVAARGAAWLAAPVLPFEDGTVLFARSFAEPRLSDWFAEYAGYVPVGSNVLAWCACRLPTAWIPYAFVAAAMVLHALAAAGVLHPAWRELGRFRSRLAVAAVAAWWPLASPLQFTTLSYVQWSALWWLVVVLTRPCGERAPGRWLQGGHVAALVLWHPLAVTLAPLLLLPSLRRGRREVVVCFLLACAACWALRVGVVTSGPEAQWSRLSEVPFALVERVAVEAACGSELRPWLAAWGGVASVWAVGLMMLAGWGCLVARALPSWSSATRAFGFAALWCGLAAVAGGAVYREELDPRSDWPVRYYALGRLALLVTATLAAATVGAWGRWCVAAAVAVAALFAGGAGRFQAHVGGWPRVASFMEDLERQERTRGGRRWIRARLVKEDGWDVLIRPR